MDNNFRNYNLFITMGLTSSLLYRFFNYDSEECIILGSMFPLTLPVALVIVIFNVFNKLLKKG